MGSSRTFVSCCYPGGTTDKEIMEDSGGQRDTRHDNLFSVKSREERMTDLFYAAGCLEGHSALEWGTTHKNEARREFTALMGLQVSTGCNM